jgi:hypothetical protein
MASRRTGKVGGDFDSNSDSCTQSVHSLLDSKAQSAGLVLADKFQSQVLVNAMIAIQSGYVGSQTLQMLEEWSGAEVDPLETWGHLLPSQEELPLLAESNG